MVVGVGDSVVVVMMAGADDVGGAVDAGTTTVVAGADVVGGRVVGVVVDSNEASVDGMSSVDVVEAGDPPEALGVSDVPHALRVRRQAAATDRRGQLLPSCTLRH